MANEQFYTHAPAGTMAVEAVVDLPDTIEVLARDEHPLIGLFARSTAKKSNPGIQEDTLAAVNNANAHAEGASAPASTDTVRSLVTNWCQLMMVSATVSDSRKATQQYGIQGDELSYQESKKMREFLRDAEATLVSDQAAQAPTPANSKLPLMNGIGAIITSHVNTNALNQTRFDSEMSAVVGDGGAPTRVFADATYRATLNGFTSTPTRFTRDPKHVDQEVMTYHSHLGPVCSFEYHHLLPQDIAGNAPHLLCLDPGLWMLKELLPLQRVVLARTGSSQGVFFQWQPCLLCRAEKGNFSFEV